MSNWVLNVTQLYLRAVKKMNMTCYKTDDGDLPHEILKINGAGLFFATEQLQNEEKLIKKAVGKDGYV